MPFDANTNPEFPPQESVTPDLQKIEADFKRAQESITEPWLHEGVEYQSKDIVYWVKAYANGDQNVQDGAMKLFPISDEVRSLAGELRERRTGQKNIFEKPSPTVLDSKIETSEVSPVAQFDQIIDYLKASDPEFQVNPLWLDVSDIISDIDYISDSTIREQVAKRLIPSTEHVGQLIKILKRIKGPGETMAGNAWADEIERIVQDENVQSEAILTINLQTGPTATKLMEGLLPPHLTNQLGIREALARCMVNDSRQTPH